MLPGLKAKASWVIPQVIYSEVQNVLSSVLISFNTLATGYAFVYSTFKLFGL